MHHDDAAGDRPQVLRDGEPAPVDPRTLPGSEAERPTQIPAKGWLQILKRAWKEGKEDNVSLMAAGVAFYAFLAIFPALIAAVGIYGLVANPDTVTQQVNDLLKGAPAETRTLVQQQLHNIVSTRSGALSTTVVIGILGALWSASGGMGNLMKAVNIAYDEDETRGFFKRRGTALLLTIGAILFVVVAVGLIAVLPGLLSSLGTAGVVLVQVARWVGLVVAVMVALAIVYRYAPDRDNPKLMWASQGALIAGVIWVVASVGFAVYASTSGSYSKTYGALAGVIVLLMWLYITAYIVLLGAEVNAEAERQTMADTTVGPPLAKGERRAVASDTTPADVR